MSILRMNIGLLRMTAIEQSPDLYAKNIYSNTFEGVITLRNVEAHNGIDGTYYTGDAITIEYEENGTLKKITEQL